MLTLCADGYYRVPDWSRLEWLEHGFGTKAAQPPGENLALVKQIHSADVVIVDHPGVHGTADAMVCGSRGVLTGVRTADCLPILLLDPVRRVTAAVHAGWRGTVQRIVERTIDEMRSNFASERGDIEAAIGPGIGVCCFQVGAEVAREFGPYHGDAKTYLDLATANRTQLRGVRVVFEARKCTFCEGNYFFSYRREREEAGRMISYIGQAA